MFQRILILKKWEEAGLKKSKKKKVRDFVKFVETHPKLGWDACAKKFYKDCYDVFDDLIPPLVDIGNNLVLLNLINRSNPKKHRKELMLLKQLAQTSDPQKLQPALKAAAQLRIPSVDKVLWAKKDLPPGIRAILIAPKKP